MATTTAKDAWLTAAQSAELLGISKKTFWRLAQKGLFTVSRLEGCSRPRYLAADLKAYFSAGVVPATAGPVAALNRAG